VIVASAIAMQFGATTLFSDLTAKSGGGYHHGQIGANGSGKPTTLKLLRGEL
jgi:ATPase subunit of ABC transporter with duplicated ATPase domains